MVPTLLFSLLTFVCLLISMAFFTLLERKALGYFQLRKGPNKVGIAGLPQPLADAAKLFTKELHSPIASNPVPFFGSPVVALFLALSLWLLYPSLTPILVLKWGVLFFLCLSGINVYTLLISGWASNSKYSLLGSLRSIAQTISYEVSMALILLTPVLLMSYLNTSTMFSLFSAPLWLMLGPLSFVWFITALAECNRTPFDLAEGESELVSGFNTEFSGGAFALIFMAEYLNILLMSLMSVVVFNMVPPLLVPAQLMPALVCALSFTFIWLRGTLPRMRYDNLMYLTWKVFLPFSLAALSAGVMLVPYLWWCAGTNG